MVNSEQEILDRITAVYRRSRASRFSKNIEDSLAALTEHEDLYFHGLYPGGTLRKLAIKIIRKLARPILDRQIQFNMATREALAQTHIAVRELERSVHAARAIDHKPVELLPASTSNGQAHAGHAKPRIAYFSPLRPIESGISEYSENLLTYLQSHWEIDLFHDDVYQPDTDIAGGRFAGHTFPADRFEDRAVKNSYHAVVYHLGNNPAHVYIYRLLLKYAGITVLHDYHISDLLSLINTRSQEYGITASEELTHHYGADQAEEILSHIRKGQITGQDLVEQQIHMNRRVFSRSLGVIVHSRWAYEAAVKEFSEDCTNIACIPLLSYPIEFDPDARQQIRSDLGITKDCFLVCAFGYVSPAKRPFSILKAFQKYLEINPSAHLVFAGAAEPELVSPLQDLIHELGIVGRVHLTGFLSTTDFCRYIQAADICVNLRYPFYGETSATLVQHLSFGKPVIVTDIGSFAEFPNDVVFKIPPPGECDEVSEMYKALVTLTEDPARRDAMSRAAIEYVASVHSPERCANLYEQFIAQVLSSASAQRKMLADYVGREAAVYDPREPGPLFKQLSQVISCRDAQAAQTFVREQMEKLS